MICKSIQLEKRHYVPFSQLSRFPPDNQWYYFMHLSRDILCVYKKYTVCDKHITHSYVQCLFLYVREFFLN